jgi:pilus assembly protein CpaB
MTRKRLLLIGVLAVGLGAISSVLVYRRLESALANATPGVNVVVAAQDVQVGAKIGESDVRVVKYPVENLPPRVFRDKAPVVGRGVVVPIGKGEFVVPDKLALENSGAGLSALIARGMRAVALRVNDVSAVAGFVVPGTRVAVLVTGNPVGSSERQTVTVLQNVPVLATGQRTERTASGDPQNSSVVTVLVSPEDSEKLALASQEGRIQLVLRNPLDTTQEKTPAIRSTSLFEGATQHQAARVQKVKSVPTPSAEPPTHDIDIYRGPHQETIHLK